MSVVVGVMQGNQVCLASDSLTSWSHFEVPCDGKIWHAGPVIYGACGGAGNFSKLRYGVEWPQEVNEQEPNEWVASHILPLLEDLDLKNDEESGGWDLLIGHPFGLVYVGDDFGIDSPSEGHMAIGLGASTALGVLYFRLLHMDQLSLEETYTAEEWAVLAVEASRHYNPTVGGDVHRLTSALSEH